jgi:integrase
MWEGANPVRKVKLPTLQNERQRFLTHEEADLLLKNLKEVSPLVHDMALISLHCGLRFGEITNLRGLDVDFENGTIHVVDPKNKKPRAAYITEAVKNMLRKRIPNTPEGYIFTDRRHNGRITNVSKTYRKVVKELEFNNGITDRRQLVIFHTLRHTHASWLALNGESLLVIQQSLGHKDLQMVRRYAHLSSDSRRQAALRLEAGFAQGKGQKDIDSQQKEK